MRKCPRCGSSKVTVILYGFPILGPRLEKEMAAGKLVLGGCCVSYDDPQWQCTDCELNL